MKRRAPLVHIFYICIIFLSAGIVSTFAAPNSSNQLEINAIDPVNNITTIAPLSGGRGLQLKVNKNDFPSITLDKYNQIYLAGDVSIAGTLKLNDEEIVPSGSNTYSRLFGVFFLYCVFFTLYFMKKVNLLKRELVKLSNGGA